MLFFLVGKYHVHQIGFPRASSRSPSGVRQGVVQTCPIKSVAFLMGKDWFSTSARQRWSMLKVSSSLLKKWHVRIVARAAPRLDFRKCQFSSWESDSSSPPATCPPQPYMPRAWAATGVTCENITFAVGKVTISNNGGLH